MMKLSFALLMSLLVLTSACTKNDSVLYEKGDANVTPISDADNVASVDNAVFVYESTEESSKGINQYNTLEPLALKDTITMTLNRHRGLKVILANLEAAEYNVESAKAGWTPRVDLRSDYGFDHQSSGLIDGRSETGMHPGGSVNLVVTQLLWDGYATRSRVDAGIATVDSITSRVFDNVTTFALDAIIAHIDVIRRREIVILSQSNVASHEKVLVSQRTRVANGAAVASDVTYTQGRLLRAYASLAQNIELAQRAESQYHRLTGIYPPVNLEAVVLPEIYSDAATAYEQAGLTNPKVQAYLYDVDAAKFNIELAKSNYHPQVNLEAGVSYSDRDTGDVNSNYEESFDTRIRMNWNLFNSFADLNAVRAATSRTTESRQFVMNFMDELENEINDTYFQYYSAIEQREFYEEAKVYNNRTRLAYLEQFDVGLKSLSDILDIESEFFSSSTEELTAKGNVAVGAYRILALAGKLMENVQIDAEAFYSMNVEEIIGE